MLLTLLAVAGAYAQAAPPPTPDSTEVTLPTQPAPLHGTMLSPPGATAVAVILPGSGPVDRDGNAAIGVSAASYRLLAEGLAARRIATIRVDKRGVGKSAPAMTDEADLRFQTYVADARAWAAEAARRSGRRCAWLIGHSEGAQVAVEAAQDAHARICGLVLLAGAGRPAGAILREQMGALPDPYRQPAQAALAKLAAGQLVPDVSPTLAALFRPSVQPYLISWLPLDPVAALGRYRGRVFIGQGENDLQVGVDDARALAEARAGLKVRFWPGVNHMLKLAPADQKENLATYRNSTLPLAPDVAPDIAAFITSHAR